MSILSGILKPKLLEAAELYDELVPKTTTVVTNSFYIPFKENDPKTFEDYLGQEGIKYRIQLRLANMERKDAFKALFSAPAGIGKTALARIIAKEMKERNQIDNYYEVVASKFENKVDLDAFMKQLKPYSLVLIDEIHGLSGAVRDALLPTLQDNVYAYGDKTSMVALPEGISWIGATTDIGQVHAALQRRLTVYHLEPMSLDDRKLLVFMLITYPMKAVALEEIAKRCWTPWEIKDEALVVVGDLAKATKAEVVDLDLTKQAFDILGIDKNGLRFRELAVLKALYNTPKVIGGLDRYAMSASALIASAGVDKKAFYSYIEPKLLQNGFIKITSAGRELTDKSLKEYFG